MFSFRLGAGLPSGAAVAVVSWFAGAPCDGAVGMVNGLPAHDVLEMLRQLAAGTAGVGFEECFLVGEVFGYCSVVDW